MEEASGPPGVEQGPAMAAPAEATQPSTSSTPAPQRKKKFTPAEQRAALWFTQAVIEDLKEYMAMTEKDVEEQYRRAGKLHQYQPDKELDKRTARIMKARPPPEGLVPNIHYYLKLIEDEED